MTTAEYLHAIFPARPFGQLPDPEEEWQWAQIHFLFGQATLGCPSYCCIDVVDEELVLATPTCGGAKIFIEAPQLARAIARLMDDGIEAVGGASPQAAKRAVERLSSWKS